MNEQEKMYFQALTKKRAGIAESLEDFAMQGVKDSVVEKYSDQAHFIYELLQNADDAKAKYAKFVLQPERLIFSHNGERHFSISDPAKEREASIEGKLGDINSITAIGASNKTPASIGKFGVGFKAVFQYTSTPHIYDPNFRFRIDRLVVPSLLKDDFPGRKKNETLFVFPFDHPKKEKKESYVDISNKLRNLSFPLLFLSNLKEIEFEYEDVIGLYEKNIKESIRFDETIAEHICLTQNNGDEFYDENLWLFSRLDSHERRYSVGFFLDKEGKLRPVEETAFCFFPTKEPTGLNFIIHAPFLLTDSREGIRAGIPHNDQMLQKLADLSADSLTYLRDIGIKKGIKLIEDSIVEIIPTNPDKFSDPADKRKVSFLPFYNSIKAQFRKTALLPSTEGYALPEDAYWGEFPQISQLFSNEQLSEIVPHDNAKWIFPTQSRYDANRYNKPLCTYIESLCRSVVNEDAIINGRKRDFIVVRGERQSLENIKGISPEFIESQSVDWLHSFYKWISETKHRIEIATDKPIFLNQNRKASAAFDKANQAILFLPVKDISGYNVVYSELLSNADTKQFIDQIGIKQPSLKDQIYNKILPMYRENEDIDNDPHFLLFFKYFCKCSNDEVDDFIDLIKEYAFISCYNEGDSDLYRGVARTMYFPTPELKSYFSPKKDTWFVAIDVYKDMIESSQENQLMQFLKELGVRDEIDLVEQEIDYRTSDRTDLPYPRSTRSMTWSETIIDGCKEIIDYISEYHDEMKSVILWDCLLKIIETKCTSWYARNLDSLLRGVCKYFYYSPQRMYFDSSDAIALKEKPWIINKDGNFVSVEDVTKETLSDQYNLECEAAQSLLAFLGIGGGDESDEEEDDTYLTDSQKEKIELANRLIAAGFDEEDLEDYQEFKHQKEARKRAEELLGANGEGIEQHTRSGETIEGIAGDERDDEDFLKDLDDGASDDEKETSSSSETHKLDKKTFQIVKDIIQITKDKPSGKMTVSQPVEDDLDIDQDEYTPAPIDYSKRIEKAKQKSAAEIEKIAYFEGLQARAIEAPKYSYGWFKALLELESINSGEANANSKEVSISFAKVEKEQGTKRTLILRHPDRYIPQFMEDLADIPLVLHMGDQKKTVAIEVANIKSYTLRVKMKNADDIKDIDLSSVTSATIDAKSPVFLIEELRKQFNELGEDRGFNNDYDMQMNLCENIEFVFGPPGTGKTTHLAKNVLIPLMKNNADCKVLVLTPTNKSADVLVRRIMEVSKDTNYNKWLVRFGATGDEEIEQSPVFRDKTFDIRTLRRNVTVTTIARFPYDFFMPQGARIFLHGINWDYIVIDEASMIPVANIVFPLYKKTPRKFIIAGDPFQIEPITSVDLWKNENIYTMVQLNSFINPKTVPYQYKVDFLTTQYRSIPDIGYVFSNFAYGGILNHYRGADSQRPLNIGNDLGVETLNIIKFPVSKYESIYRCKRLQHSSSYQVYSALFTFEYVCYLSRAIAEKNPGSLFKIGVIAPYRAQADMIDKLLASEKLPRQIDVQTGTIHGFQGDECDIIFAVFNTPPTISGSKDMFLNKRNIINVSISRARDYLFIVMPDDKTENINNLRLVKRVEKLAHDTEAWNEFLSPDLEELMFGDPKYLENNAFSTSHQSVNVYGLPEKCYEVRTEDTAVDVQIHKGASKTSSETAVKLDATNDHIQDLVTQDIEEKSDDADENLIPKGLRKNAVKISVEGAMNGFCYLVPYNGKLRDYTIKKTTGMFIPQSRNGKQKMVSVSVVEEDRIIYITKEMFKLYEKEFNKQGKISLRTSFFEKIYH